MLKPSGCVDDRVPCRSIKDITAEDYKHHLVDATVTAFAEAIATAVDHEDGVYCESQVDVAVSTPYSNAECWSTTNVHDDNSYHSYIVTACAHLTFSNPCIATPPPPPFWGGWGGIFLTFRAYIWGWGGDRKEDCHHACKTYQISFVCRINVLSVLIAEELNRKGRAEGLA